MRLFILLAGVMLGMVIFGAIVAPASPAPPLPTALAGNDSGWIADARALLWLRLGLYAAGLLVTIVVLWFVIVWELHTGARDWLVAHGIGNRWLLVGVYGAGVLVLLGLLALPFDYLGFVLRQRYGLANESLLSWLLRYALANAINLALALVALQGFYWLVRALPRSWWLVASVGYLLLMIGLVYLQPLVITPLFYRQTRLPAGELRTRILDLGQRAGVPIDDVFVIDASKEGNEGNAYFTGVGGSTRVVIYDTLLTDYPPDELLAILAHEFGHWREHHVWKGLALAALVTPIVLGSLEVANRWWLPRWGVTALADVASLPVLLLLLIVGSTVTMPLQNAVSRRWEATADRIAVTTTGDGAAVASTFARLARQNKTLPDPPRLVEGIFATHPAIGRRVATALGHDDLPVH